MSAASLRKLKERIAPLDVFSPSERMRIDSAVWLERPPEKWKYFGDPEDLRPMAAIPSRAWVEWHAARGVDPFGLRDSIRPKLRNLVIARDGLMCKLCGDQVERDDVHIDHIIPVAKGGQTLLTNLQVTHSTCNMRKGAR